MLQSWVTRSRINPTSDTEIDQIEIYMSGNKFGWQTLVNITFLKK